MSLECVSTARMHGDSVSFHQIQRGEVITVASPGA